MLDKIYQLARTARPRQWLKNFSLFAAPVFAGTLFEKGTLASTFEAFLVFCAVASGVYFFNDLKDAERDKQHPVKKNRAIASGRISRTEALLITTALFVGGLWYSVFYIGTFFALAVATYIVLMLAYSLHFKNVIILEALIVASGFIIRVFAGGFASESSISSWLVLTTIGLSMLIAFGKRRSEKTLLLKKLSTREEIATRETLRHYPDKLLDSMISMSATFCIITYSLFAFLGSSESTTSKLYSILPSIISTPKWMMLTIPLVIYGVARYLYVIYEKEEGESPERVLLSDKPLLTSVVLWGITTMVVIYVLPALG